MRDCVRFVACPLTVLCAMADVSFVITLNSLMQRISLSLSLSLSFLGGLSYLTVYGLARELSSREREGEGGKEGAGK